MERPIARCIRGHVEGHLAPGRHVDRVLARRMVAVARHQLEEVERRAGYLWKFLEIPQKQGMIAELEQQMTAANFWDSQKQAQKVISECNLYKNIIAFHLCFQGRICQ